MEQPANSLLSLPFVKKKKFVDDDYLLRFGFIRSKRDPVLNPFGLPVGFARTFSQNMPGINGQTETVGFTCAACHTSHFVYDNGLNGPQEYIIEGGPATTDFGLLQSNLTAAIGQLVVSAKVPLMGGRFDRFAKNVLGQSYSATTKQTLSNDLVEFAKAQMGGSDTIEVVEGFTRLDALNRIGNAVFADNVNRPQNKAAIDAPVNYPHIWTTSWFDWVQYDASVMGPLIRNVGEAMGVKAFIDTVSSSEDYRFSSSIPIGNLVWIESFLSGEQPTKETGFGGLHGPTWNLNTVDQNLANKGKALYTKRCQGCHLPPLNDPDKAIFEDAYFAPIVWNAGGIEQKTDNVLQLEVIPLATIGTDRGQAKVMINRTMDTSGDVDGTIIDKTSGMGIATEICARDFNVATLDEIGLIDDTTGEQSSAFERTADGIDFVPLKDRWVKDGGNISFGYALAAIVEHTIQAWFEVNDLTDYALQEKLKVGRPNCIQAGMGYKARPLNGVWATAPFLHNGSVATLRDLLCPKDGKRPTLVQLGNIEFDVKNIGIKQPDDYQRSAQKRLDKGTLYDKDGYFILDTRVNGNLNTGHYFSDDSIPGKIGPAFNEAECDAMLEYLKTI
jgi:hypothetical protein